MAPTVAGTNFRTLDLNLLRVFDEVMAERNLTRAARNLSLTQPAVSNALRRLRETLGDELVRRSGQGMEPTPQEWQQYAEPIGRFMAMGLLERSGTRLRLTSRGVLLSNDVFQEFLS